MFVTLKLEPKIPFLGRVKGKKKPKKLFSLVVNKRLSLF